MNKDNTPIHQGSHKLKILTKGSWYFVSSIIVKAMAILILPVTTRYLNPHEIGVLDTLDSLRQFMPIFISLALDEAYYRFYFKYNKNKDDLQKYISTYFWIIIIWGLIVFGISLIIGQLVLTDLFKVNFHPFITLTMIGPLLLQLSVLGGVHFKQALKAELLSTINTVLIAVFYLFYLLLLIVWKMGAEAKIYGFFISDILSVIIFSSVLFRARLIAFKFDKKIMIEGLHYSIPLIPTLTSSWITGLSDRLILGIYKTFSSTGIYSIGYKLGQTLKMVSESIFMVYKPIMFSMMTDNREEAIKKIENFFPYFFYLIFWIGFCIAFFSKETVIILTESKFHSAYIITPLVVAAYFFGAMYKLFYHIVSFHKKTWLISAGALIQAVSNIILNLIFIPLFGNIAAALTTLFSYIIFFLWMFYWSQKIDPITIKWKNLSLTIFMGICVTGVYFLTTYLIDLSFIIKIFFKLLLLSLTVGASYKLKLINFRLK